MTVGRVAPLSPAHASDALAYLDGSPYENVFLTWLISGDRANAGGAATYVFLDGAARVRGVISFGRQVVLAAADDTVVRALADVAPVHRFERMIVGPRWMVECYWQTIQAWHVPARITRTSQPLLIVNAETLRGDTRDVTVRPARQTESEIVANHSAQMIEHELGYDPRRFPEFTVNVRRTIERGFWWVGEYEGRICFVCNAGPRSAKTLQLQGIWTPPPLRRRGLAAAALSGICRHLLESVPSLSLYVNDFNTAALALYERLGFTQVGEFATLLF